MANCEGSLTEGADCISSNKEQPDIVPSTCEAIREAIAAVERLDLSAVSIEEIKDQLTSVFRGYVVSTPVFDPGLTLYRARILPEKPELLSDIAAPPPTLVSHSQRCNRAGESMFYSSSARNAPFFERHAKPGQNVVLSKWRTTERLLVNNVGYTTETFGRLQSTRDCPQWHRGSPPPRLSSEANVLISEFLASTFSADIPEGSEDRYKLTIAITEKLISTGMFGGLIYPTIPMNGNADNFALKPKFVSTGLTFVRAEYIAIDSIEGKKMAVRYLDIATDVSDSGRLTWKGRPGQWVKNKGDSLIFTVENGEWVARDHSGNIVEPE